MFRLIGFLVIFALTAGGFVFVDYKMSARWAGREDAGGLTFREYLGGLSGRISGLGGGGAQGMPTKLADMLPKPPEGWKARPVEAGDTEGFLPKSDKKADKKGIAAVTAMAGGEAGSGVEVAALTYEKGDRKLIVKAVRYPNLIFTSMAAMPQRLELQMQTAEFRGTEFATVRGLDVTEDLLPDGFRGRMFLADVGGQIHLRVLAPKRMKDEELVPFLQTLHVKAMNADVVDKVEGLGEVPVIVLASALEGAERDAYLADVAARGAAKAAHVDAESAEAAAAQTTETPVEDSAGGGFLSTLFGGGEDPAPEAEAAAPAKSGKVGCTTGKDGVKRCTVATAAPGG
ncbi:hypothetical protein [Tabrizicola sp.]|uniref:hypothetical protein n=1 Tax=Tabrizicola sp. TaxID=2005166 RepID=UPI002FDE45BF